MGSEPLVVKLQKVNIPVIPGSKKAREKGSQIHILEIQESDFRMGRGEMQTWYCIQGLLKQVQIKRDERIQTPNSDATIPHDRNKKMKEQQKKKRDPRIPELRNWKLAQKSGM